jgi:hypothetical protein
MAVEVSGLSWVAADVRLWRTATEMADTEFFNTSGNYMYHMI